MEPEVMQVENATKKRRAAEDQLHAILMQANVPEAIKAKLQGALVEWKLDEETTTDTCAPRHKRLRKHSPERAAFASEAPDGTVLTLSTHDGSISVTVSTEAFSALSGFVRDLVESSAGGHIVLPHWLTKDSLNQMCDLSDFYARLAGLDCAALGGEHAVGLAAAEAEADHLASLDLTQTLGLLRAASYFEAERPLELAALSVCAQLRGWPLEAVVALVPSLRRREERGAPQVPCRVPRECLRPVATSPAASAAAVADPAVETAAAPSSGKGSAKRPVRRGLAGQGPAPMPALAYEPCCVDVLDRVMAQVDDEFVLRRLQHAPTAALALGAFELKRRAAERCSEQMLGARPAALLRAAVTLHGDVARGVRCTTLAHPAVGLAMFRAKHTLDTSEGWYGPYLRETALLKALHHPHVVGLKAFFLNPDSQCPTFAYEWAPCSMRDAVAAAPAGAEAPLSLPSVRSVLYQAARGVAFLHSRGVLHRRISLSYLVFDPRPIKIFGFGHARHMDPDAHPEGREMTMVHDWGTTLAPEVLVQTGHAVRYSHAVDVWSLGLVLMQLVRGSGVGVGEVLPLGNADRVAALYSYFRLLGTPTAATWPGLGKLLGEPWGEPAQTHGHTARAVWPQWAGKDLGEEFPLLPPSGADLLARLLCLDPQRRISAAACLDHPFFDELDKAGVGTAPLPEMAPARQRVEAWLGASLPSVKGAADLSSGSWSGSGLSSLSSLTSSSWFSSSEPFESDGEERGQEEGEEAPLAGIAEEGVAA